MVCFENVRALEGNRGKFGGWCQVAENKRQGHINEWTLLSFAVGGAGERDRLLLVD